MTKTCPNCFSANLDTNKFCSNCGTPLQSVAATSGTATPGSETPAGSISSLWSPSPTSYVVKTTSDADGPAGEPQGSTVPMSTFSPPPAPSSAPVQYFASETPLGAAGPAGPSAGYQGYVPGASSRNQGAAFMPYAPGTAAPLEKPKDSRSFLVPIILGVVVLLLALAGVSGWLVLSNSNNSDPGSSAQGSPGGGGGVATKPPSPVPTVGAQATKVPENAPEEDKVKEVIRISNDEQIKAWRDLDTDILKGTRTGKVLDEQIGMVNDLKKGQMYAIPVNIELKYLDVNVNGDKATVRTREIWTVTFYRKEDNKKIESRGPDTLVETYSLTKINGKWMIDKLVFDEENGQTPTPGGN